MNRWVTGAVILAALAMTACEDKRTGPDRPASAKSPLSAQTKPIPSKPATLPDRATFNRTAAELALPLFWIADGNNNQVMDPSELAVLTGIDGSTWTDWTGPHGFSDRFDEAIADISAVAARGADLSQLEPTEQKRRQKVLEELRQGRPTLLHADFSQSSIQDRKIVLNLLEAARVIERLYAKQTGAHGLAAQIPADDPASRMLFYRNQGPFCERPKTETDPDCGALAEMPPRTRTGLYPDDLEDQPGFCAQLDAHPNQKALLTPFSVVTRDAAGGLTPVPYNEIYKADMASVGASLKAAAAAITSADEAAFKAYLLAAAQAFSDNEWEPADAAWAAMNVSNSKWYLRIGPDETYFEPCSRKAGFHVSFARINQDSLTWQKRLTPLKADLEKTIAALAGPPYVARDVAFHLPDFIDILLNAGDSRSAVGATIGQSLPNWGRVAEQGGRTVVMTNLYTDVDSRAAFREQASAVFCSDTIGSLTDDDEAMVMSTVLHEAAHNLGPSHDYTVEDKTASEIFGGPIASMLEELKAQTAALYLSEWLVKRKVVPAAAKAREAHTRDIAWTFGHISQGMYTPEGKPRAYSQLSSIQSGYLLEQGALVWTAETNAANGKDKGCLSIDPAKFAAGAETLIREVAGIKSRGDVAGLEALKARYVDAKDAWSAVREQITERWLRAPKASFVYSLNL